MSGIGYAIGGLLVIIAALWLLRSGGWRTSFTARRVTGSNVYQGENHGTLTMTAHHQPGATDAAAPADRVAWGIGAAGVVVALASLIRDLIAG